MAAHLWGKESRREASSMIEFPLTMLHLPNVLSLAIVSQAVEQAFSTWVFESSVKIQALIGKIPETRVGEKLTAARLNIHQLTSQFHTHL